jgi:quinol-cytochrome oxidoreductase complex cytochrome b subunit
MSQTLNILQRIRLSVFPGSRKAAQDQNDQRKIFRGLLLHFRPRTVPERTLKISHAWGLGVMAVVLLFLLLCTGLILKFVYAPFPDRAYDSIVYLNNQVPFGQLLRNVHRWSANGLLFIVFLHFLRVFYTGAFAAPRQFNWIIGLFLFTAVIFSNFTGYLLPWDQIAFWAITISTSMLDYIPGVGTGLKEWILGGTEPGPATLRNFYAIHTAILPALLLFFLSFHAWRIRRAGGLTVPRSHDEDPAIQGKMVESMPHLIKREVALALIVLATVLLIAMFVDAPLADKANPGLSPNPTKAPWYFMGVQEMLMHFHPVFATLVIPSLLVLGLLSIPYINYETNTSGIWFCSRKGRKMALIAVVVATLATIAAVLFDEFVISANTVGPPNMINNGLLPFAILLAVCTGFYLMVKKGFAATNNEAIQALFTLLMTAFVILTIIGIWFRGTGMQLMWAA